MVGAGRRRRAAGAPVRRRRRQIASPISAPRPAARRRSSRMPAPASPRSTARRPAWRGCATISRGSRWTAETVVADAAEWQVGDGDGFDGILIDAPCTSTGTIRRHPDVAWLRQETDIAALAAFAEALARQAVALLRPGGTLVYCTCSLEPEEGEQAVAALLASESAMRRRPIEPSEVAGLARDPDCGGRPAYPAVPPAASRTPVLAASTAFTPRGWLNPDFTPTFAVPGDDSPGFKMVCWRPFPD